jgi:small subunit ribosomal protein S1
LPGLVLLIVDNLRNEVVYYQEQENAQKIYRKDITYMASKSFNSQKGGDNASLTLLSEFLEKYMPAKLKKGDIIEGKVVQAKKGMLLVDVGGKAEGVISGRELHVEDSDLAAMKTGDPVFVYVLNPEDEKGQIQLSLRRADILKKWVELEEAKKTNGTVEVVVLDANSGGLLVKTKGGLPGFIPSSQLDSSRLYKSTRESRQEAIAKMPVKLSEFIGQKIQTKIIEIDKEKNRIILSEKLLTSGEDFSKREETLRTAKIGDIFDGTVTGVTPFGLFVNAEGLEGLVHLSEISWDKVSDPADFHGVSDKVKVQLIGLSDNGKRVAYSIKRLINDPWANSISQYKQGQIVHGVVQKIVDYGVFVKIDDGLNGLIHISELSNDLVDDPSKIVKVGDELDLKIISISPSDRHLGLSLKRVAHDDGSLPVDDVKSSKKDMLLDPESRA